MDGAPTELVQVAAAEPAAADPAAAEPAATEPAAAEPAALPAALPANVNPANAEPANAHLANNAELANNTNLANSAEPIDQPAAEPVVYEPPALLPRRPAEIPGRASLITGVATRLDKVFTQLRPPPRDRAGVAPPQQQGAAPQAQQQQGGRRGGGRRGGRLGQRREQEQMLSTCELLCELLAKTDEGSMLVRQLTSHADIERLRCTSKVVRACVDNARHLVGLLRRDVHLQPHQHADIAHMSLAEDPPGWSFGMLRGGVLADAPGLGKTVTMIALILSSLGTLPKTPSTFWDATRLADGWARMLRNRVSRQELLPMLVRLRRAGCAVPEPLLAFADGKDLDRRAGRGAVPAPFPTIGAFEDAVRAAARSVPAGQVERVRESVRKQLIKMRLGLDPKNRQATHGPHGLRALFERELWPVSTTLIIVPKPLLQHWAEQLRLLLDLGAISPLGPAEGGRGAVWVDDLGASRDLADCDPSQPVPCHGGASAAALLDEPQLAARWARFAIVVTSFERCASEARRADEWSTAMWAADEARRSPLTALRWLRLVVDEGHALGGGVETESISGAAANKFIAGLAAERRWVLSGTPTVGTDERASLRQMHTLLGFLREPTLGLAPHRDFERTIAQPFLRGDLSAEARLLGVLQPIMVRHTKEDIRLPDPKVLSTEWDGRRHWDRASQTEREHVDKVFEAAAEHVLNSLLTARRLESSGRPTKAIVYADGSADLEQFQHFIVRGWQRLHGHANSAAANEAVALHYVSDGRDYRASELSRFRHNKLRCRECARCGLLNDEHDGGGERCTRFLINVRFDPLPFVPTVNGLHAPHQADPLAGTEAEVEEERVQLRDLSYPSGWRPWTVADFYTRHPTSQRVRVRCTGGVDGSTLPPPVGRTSAFQPADQLLAAQQPVPAAQQPVPAAGGQQPPPPPPQAHAALRECLLVGHTRCRQPLRGGPWQTRRVDTPLMLLCADGSHGLDLSLVTHIFLLGRIRDPAIKQQVVSRADRMGAVADADGRGCQVETLLLWHDEELRSPAKKRKQPRHRPSSPPPTGG